MEYEKRFIELLGFNIIGPDGSNRWKILDENNNQVGYVQRKKIKNKNTKKNLSAIYGYETKIATDKLQFNSTTLTENKETFTYSFDVLESGEKVAGVELNLGEFPTLHIWSEEYGFMVLKIDFEQLYMNYKSKTENFNIEEMVFVKLDSDSPNGKEYIYQLRYCDKEQDINDSRFIITSELKVKKDDVLDETVGVCITTWKGNDCISKTHSVVKGTVSEVIKKHKYGIYSMSHFRYLINKILPFNRDIINILLQNKKILGNSLSLLVPDYNFDNAENKYDWVSNISNNVKFCVYEDTNSHNTINWGDILYKTGEICHFGHVITNSIVNQELEGYYCYNEKYIFMCYDDDTLVKVFDVKNKKIIDDKALSQQVYNEYKNSMIKTKNINNK